MSICPIFSAYRLDYIFRSIDVIFYVYLPDLICTVYLCLFSSPHSCALRVFQLFVGIWENSGRSARLVDKV